MTKFWKMIYTILLILLVVSIIASIYAFIEYKDTPVKDLPLWVVWFFK